MIKIKELLLKNEIGSQKYKIFEDRKLRGFSQKYKCFNIEIGVEKYFFDFQVSIYEGFVH